MLTSKHIELYQSLFRGRTDVYAVRWEKGISSGYMPAYKVDWSEYNNHKANGGNFASYKNKEYLALDCEAIKHHLMGNKVLGIYPLLSDNTSHFIAADFDEANWKDTILRLYKICVKNELPAYIERSRSGNGGHLWIFFEENIPAFQSRAILFSLLMQSGIISRFDKEPSFDRLFPNQDQHSGKGLGNLIALPLQGTSIGVELIAQKRQPTLILVHRKQLLDQWIDRIQNTLGIPKKEIGQIGGQKEKIGKVVTVAMIQSLVRYDSLAHLADKFGMIIVDECHHIPAKSFRNVITQFNSYYLYGLTATPYRKNNDEKLIYVYIGNIIFSLEQQEYLRIQEQKIEINIKETLFSFPYDRKIDEYEQLSKVAIYDTRRNEQIITDIKDNVDRFKMILVLTERKAHVDILNQYLKSEFETITISGDDSERSRKSKLEQIELGHCKIVISTGQFFGEGIDISNLECLFIVYPFSFEAKLVQYIGRIQRSKQAPVIFDYRDINIPYFEKMFKKRNRYYNKLRNIDYSKIEG